MSDASRCEVCGFDAGDYDVQDAVATLHSFDARWRWTLEGCDRSVIVGLPEPAANRSPEAFADQPSLLAAVHDGTHRLVLAGRARAAVQRRPTVGAVAGPSGAGLRPSRQVGAVAFVNVSNGGAPKRPVARTTIGHRGLASDRQAERRHHGRPWQAVSLWSAEVIAALVAESHPIGPGCAGENLTLSGLDWAELRPGTRLGIGADVVIELTAFAAPCRKIAGCFADRAFSRVDHDRHPGVGRLYGSVLRTGDVVTGAPVVIEPGE